MESVIKAKTKFKFLINGEVKEISSRTKSTAINDIRKIFPVGHLKPSEIQLTPVL